jgi:hypothetical protein
VEAFTSSKVRRLGRNRRARKERCSVGERRPRPFKLRDESRLLQCGNLSGKRLTRLLSHMT